MALSWGAQANAAESESDFFDGRTITYIVSTDPGGGYDLYGRLLARNMGKYLPGARILVRNVPGAGQIIGANTIYASRPDGLTFGIFNTGMIYGQLLALEGIRFDLREMSWIGSLAAEGRALMVSQPFWNPKYPRHAKFGNRNSDGLGWAWFLILCRNQDFAVCAGSQCANYIRHARRRYASQYVA